ncbi:transmembrane protein 241-like isoform X1 [Schistocerca americana]|uniref:transmembrane protein 241-like isoform X1 n=2 Tax=Schistocerca americana TaxID=7009 RepID=UPI001F4F1DEB|nr:transmembrane protein 241-like isoform X1 [Schistocerca americana]
MARMMELYCALIKKMHCAEKIVYSEFVTHSFLFVSTVFINKYVLSVLSFTYPTVFQAWQTLVGAVIFKYLNAKKMLDVVPLDRSAALQLLPHCVFFVGGIVAGSKALSKLPIPVFVSVGSLPRVCVFLLDYVSSAIKATALQLTAGLVCLLAATSVILLDVSLPFADSGYTWLLAHVVFITAQILHGRITDSHYTETDKLYYSNIFSVVVLAPASFYLEEAFSVLHFRHRRQIRFYIGCLCSGVLGTCLQLWAPQTRAAPQANAVARMVACLLALPVFGRHSPDWQTVSGVAVIGLVCATIVPSLDEVEPKEKHTDLLSV